jgi:hypothetical protein
LTANAKISILFEYSGHTLLNPNMPDKQKFTIYIPDDLHRQFKVRSALEGETMSAMAQRALEFYLQHADVVDNLDALQSQAYGQTYRIHSCPKCAVALSMGEDGLALVKVRAEQQFEELTGLERIAELNPDSCSPDEGELITC